MYILLKKTLLISLTFTAITIIIPFGFTHDMQQDALAHNISNDRSNNNKLIKPEFIPPVAIEWAKNQQKLIAENKASHQMHGIASYYGKKFHGRLTANGEKFNMYDLTAAHRTLPFNTIVLVTHINTGKSVTVRINDRGPFLKNRVIDLSKAAASEIDMIKHGTAPVTLKILKLGTGLQKKQQNPRALQIASYQQEQSAQNLINTLAQNNITSYIEANQNYFRVLVPVDKTSLSTTKSMLADLGYTNTLVRYK